jgi:hypothetical protein
MKDLTITEVGRALEEAFRVDLSDEVRVDLEAVAAVPLPAPSVAEAIGATEEIEYREFATLLGITDDEPPVRMVTMPQAEYDALKAESDKLGPMLDEMRRRPTEVSPEEEAEYQAFLSLIGPV